jgi:hypothetical protein
MTPRSRKSDGDGDHEEARDEGEQRGSRRGERPRGHGREREVFLEYVTRRWAGSPPPTAEAYARAESQWRQLPGAVITVPTDLGSPPKQTPPPEGDDGGPEP